MNRTKINRRACELIADAVFSDEDGAMFNDHGVSLTPADVAHLILWAHAEPSASRTLVRALIDLTQEGN
jgi:hypothetical protein